MLKPALTLLSPFSPLPFLPLSTPPLSTLPSITQSSYKQRYVVLSLSDENRGKLVEVWDSQTSDKEPYRLVLGSSWTVQSKPSNNAKRHAFQVRYLLSKFNPCCTVYLTLSLGLNLSTECVCLCIYLYLSLTSYTCSYPWSNSVSHVRVIS